MANTGQKKQTNSKNTKPKTPTKAPSSSAAKKKAAPEAEMSRLNINRQTAAILYLAAAAFAGALVFIEGESVWRVIHAFLFRVFGFCAYVLPLLFAYMALVCARNKSSSSATANLISSGVFTVLISTAIHIFGHASDYLTQHGVGIQISNAWNEEAANKSGGVLGALLGGLIAKLFGKTGAVATVVILLIAAFLLVTGISLPLIFSFIKKPVQKVSDYTGRRMEENAEKREELRKQRELEAAENEQKKKKLPEAIDPDAALKPAAPKKKSSHSLVPEIEGASDSGTLHEPDMPVTVSVPAADPKIVPAAIDPAVTAAAAAAAAAKPPVKPEKKRSAEKPLKPVKNADGSIAVQRKKENYVFPPISCLQMPENTGIGDSMEEMQNGARKLVATLESFKIKATVTNISRGPSVTRYELVPEAGVRINRITNLSDDIALRLAAKSVRIEAPIPGKAAIGVEIPNASKSNVTMREILDTDQYRAGSEKSKLNVALGKDITGNIITADLAKMPHLLVAGTTGSGKSVCLNSMIISILYNASPDEVKLLMIDPKMVEFTVYNGIAHLEVPVVSNARKAAGALGWAVSEMEKRYTAFSENGVRDIKGFNKLCETRDDLEKMHQIVIFIDELSDLMMASPKEVEDSICRLAQMARAAGIHLVIATQRPSVDVITGIIKANIPSRIALFVSSQTDSRTILDQGGAEKLLGNGDMLFNPVGASKPQRLQGCYISDKEVEAVVAHIKKQSAAVYNDDTMREIEAKAAAAAQGSKRGPDDDESDGTLDPMFEQAAEVVITAGQASTTMLQKKLKLGYARASRVMDELEENGIVGPQDGSKPRQVLMTKQQWYESQALARNSGNRDVQLDFDSVTGAKDKPAPQSYFGADEPDDDESGFAPDDFEDIPFDTDEPVPEDDYDEPAEPDDYYEEPEAEEEYYDEPVTPADDEDDDIPFDAGEPVTDEGYEEPEDGGEEDFYADEGDDETGSSAASPFYREAPEESNQPEEPAADDFDGTDMFEEVVEIPPEEPDEDEDVPAPAEQEPEEFDIEEDEPAPQDNGGDNADGADDGFTENEYYEEIEDYEPVSADDVFEDDDFYDGDDDDIDSFFN